MKQLLKYFFILFFLLPPAYSQLSAIDSLKLALKNAAHDTTRCSVLNAMIEAESDEQLWPKYNQQLRDLAEKNIKKNDASKNVYLKYLGFALNNVGYQSNFNGDIPKALEYYNKSLNIMQELKDKFGIAYALNNIGNIYDEQGDVLRALDFFHRSLKIREEIGDEQGIANSLNNIGLIYDRQNDLTKALEYYHKSLAIMDLVGHKIGSANSLNNIGAIYFKQKNFTKALEYYEKSLKIREEIGDKHGMAYALNNIGNACDAMGDHEKALNCFQKSLKLSEEMNHLQGIAYALGNIANIKILKGEMKEALMYATRSMEASKKLGIPDNIKTAASKLKSIFEKQGKYKEAFEMFELEIKMRDSINNQETQKASVKKQMQYEYDKKELMLKAEQDKKDVISKEELKQKEKERNYFMAGFALVIVLALFIFRGYRQKQKANAIITLQKHMVELKQKEILDSIHYAKRIQSALMISENNIEAILNRLKKN